MLCLRIFDRKWRRKMAYNNMAVNQEKVITSRPWANYIMLFFLFMYLRSRWIRMCMLSVNTLAASTLRLRNLKEYFGLPPTPIIHQNGAFRKHLSKRRILKTPSFHFRVDKKSWDFSPPPPSSKKKTTIVALFSSFGAVCMENIWWVFKVKPPFWTYSGEVGTGASNQDRNHWQAFLFGNVCYCYTIFY